MANNPSTTSRHARFAGFLAQDPDNPVLLAECAQAALQEGLFPQAQQHIDAGMRLEGATTAWRFRLANLRIAERRLDEARELLQALQAEAASGSQAGTQAHDAATGHNLAYVSFLQSGFAACADLLQPWLTGERAATDAEQDAMLALWLRAMHQQGRLQEAWTAIETRGIGRVGVAAAGVASLVALDFDRAEAAQQLASKALDQTPDHPEACIAAASIAMASQDHSQARQLLGRVTTQHPHQARAWSMLGFLGIVETRATDAIRDFARALALAPGDIATRVGMGWAQLMGGSLGDAIVTFRAAIALDESSADARGALAAALAMQGDRAAAEAELANALRLEAGNAAALFARSILDGGPDDPQGIQRMATRPHP